MIGKCHSIFGRDAFNIFFLLKIPRVMYRICPSEFNTALSASIKSHSWLIKMYWDIFAYWQSHFLSDTHRTDASNMNVYVDSVEQVAI